MAIDWKGVFPAVTTKFTDKDTLDLDLFTVNIKAQLAAGVNGIILGGTLGEASVLTNAEKEILVKETIKLVDGKVPVVINIAEGSTSVAIQCAKDAENWGAKGLMLLPPMRYKSDHRETVQYFKDIAASTSLPIMIYNNPVDYKVDVTIDMFAELAKVPSIQAVKESTRDVTNVTRMRNAFGDRFRILCGVDTLALEEFMPLLELDIHAKLVQYIKFAESKTGIGSETVRRPRLILEGEERKRIESIIDTGVKNRPTLPEFHSL